MLAAAEELTARGLAKIILLGEAEPVQAEARRLGLDISQACSLPDARLRQYVWYSRWHTLNPSHAAESCCHSLLSS